MWFLFGCFPKNWQSKKSCLNIYPNGTFPLLIQREGKSQSHHFFSCNHLMNIVNSADLGRKRSIFAGKIVASKENQRINPCVVDHNWGYTPAKFSTEETPPVSVFYILYKGGLIVIAVPPPKFNNSPLKNVGLEDSLLNFGVISLRDVRHDKCVLKK